MPVMTEIEYQKGWSDAEIADWLAAPEAIDRFMQRGPMSDYMRPIPIRILMSGEAALIGAAALQFDEVPVR